MMHQAAPRESEPPGLSRRDHVDRARRRNRRFEQVRLDFNDAQG